jgi:hypothetical protein
MIITRIREPSGTNAQTEVRDHGFPKEAGMAGLSISSNHRPRILPGCSTRGTDPGTRDRWRRLDVLAPEPFGCIRVAAVVLIGVEDFDQCATTTRATVACVIAA